MSTRLFVEGGHRLTGSVEASGAKNAILPLLAATIMFDGESKLLNIPPLGDVNLMVRMLNALNIRTEFGFNEDVMVVNTKRIRHIAPYELVTSMRASFFVAGPLLAKTGFAKVPLPGGCSIGLRPVDIHLKGFEALGAAVNFEHGFVELRCEQLKGTRVHLAFPSVGATENLMMAACLAEGETVLENVACEPEIQDLARFLRLAGAIIEGEGTSTIRVQGVQSLSGVKDYEVIPDRVEVATLLIAGAVTKGDVTVTKARPEHLGEFLSVLETMGLDISCEETAIRCRYVNVLDAVDVETQPYPGFPTDMQAQLMTLLTQSSGKSVIKERIFENRFMHALELMRMGADIRLDDHYAVINGGQALSGAEVKITDLRAGAALVLAGLAAEGETIVYGLKHLYRGYYNLVEKLSQLGAVIKV